MGVDTASVLRAALQLYRARQFPAAAVVCGEAVENDPDNLYLRLLRARALLALRNDGEAQKELAECVTRDPRCAEAFRLLGELGIRRDEAESAAVFLREALRLDPGHTEAEEWLGVAEAMVRKKKSEASRRGHRDEGIGSAESELSRFGSATAGEKLPAAPAVAGRSSDSLPEASGFGQYLMANGVVTEKQLRAALAYKQATGVRLGRAVSTLGFASELKIEWASLAYHGRHRRPLDAVA
jgi:tetratricopeptide (TPR) repeat protein